MSTSREQRYLTPGSADGRKDRGLKRSTLALLSILGLLVLAAASLPASAATRAGSSPRAASDSSKGYDEPFCQSSRTTCADDSGKLGGEYVGHDEPSVLFKSGRPGSGNDMT